MKSYAECQSEISDKLKRACPDGCDNAARQAGFLVALATDLLYETELLRDQSNTREMHQLLERFGGGK